MQNNFIESVSKVCEILNKHSVEYLIVGGTAVAFHGFYRASRAPSGQLSEKHDLDFWYNPTYDNYYRVLDVLGFIAASLIFSFLLSPSTVKSVAPILNSLRTIWFGLAFVCIGLEANFTDLLKFEGGRPALTFVSAQLFNIIWTLLWSYLLFGGYIFPIPDFK